MLNITGIKNFEIVVSELVYSGSESNYGWLNWSMLELLSEDETLKSKSLDDLIAKNAVIC